MLVVGALVDANDFRGVGRIDGEDFGGGAVALAADDQVVFAAEQGLDIGQGSFHEAPGVELVEVEERLVDEGLGTASFRAMLMHDPSQLTVRPRARSWGGKQAMPFQSMAYVVQDRLAHVPASIWPHGLLLLRRGVADFLA